LDTIYRAKEIFWNTSLTLFTQEFHLKRALYICEWLKIDCVWVKTDLQNYLYIDYYNNREILARYKAFLNILFSAKPKFLWDKIDMNWVSNFW
jgi:SanA protein